MLLLSLLVSGCAGTAKIPEFHVAITRPANQDGMRVNVLTGVYELVPRAEWVARERKTIKLELKDWEIVKKALYGQCIAFKCTQTLDLISGVFESLDQAIGHIPGVK